MAGRSRVGAWLAALAAALLSVGFAPAAAWADSVKVSAQVTGAVRLDRASCQIIAVVYTFASFDQGARYDDVKLEFSGPSGSSPPAGRFDSHNPGGATADNFVFIFDVGAFKPGDYTMKVTWSAHNGNGFSRGFGTGTGTLTIPADPTIVKLGTESKCGMQRLADSYNHAALTYGAAAETVRESCAKCAQALDSAAATSADLSWFAESLAIDPPDPAYTSLPVATPPEIPTIAAGGGISPDAAAAFTAVLNGLAGGIGQARAALSAIERAQGAHLAGDTNWESQQSLAAAGFLNGLVTNLTALSATMTTASGQLKAAGFPNPTVDATAARKAATKAMISGPPTPPGFPDWYRQQAGLPQAAIKDIATDLGLAAEAHTDPVPVLDAFTGTELKESMAGAAAALTAEAAALTAQPLLNHATDPGPTPSPTASPTPSAGPTVAEQSSLVSNGGFEAPALPAGSGYRTVTAGKGPGLTDWVLKQGSIEIVEAGSARAATGGQFIDLNGNDSAAGPGTISQDVAVTAGRTYRLSFQLAGNPNGTPAVKTVRAKLGTREQTFTFDTTGHTNADLGWTTHTVESAACGSPSVLTVAFTSLTEGIRGPNLDNVVLTDTGGASCTPFPIWLVVLAAAIVTAIGVGVVIYLRRRSGQAKVPAATTAG